MKKTSLMIPLLLLSSLQASYHDKPIHYVQSKNAHGPIYRIKIGAFSTLSNAQKAQRKVAKSYILKGEKYYSLYLGIYHDRAKALRALNTLSSSYHDAYLITTYRADKKVSKTDFMQEAKAYFQKGDYESALALYDKEMILHPNNHLAALEYARTLYMLGFYKQSKKAFLEVLSHNPPRQVKKNIHYFLEKIDSKFRTNSFFGAIMIGVSYDDNLGYNTSDKTFSYGSFLLQNETTKTKGFYSTLNLELTHRYESENFTWENSFYTYNEFQQQNSIDPLNFIQLSSALSKRYHAFTLTLPVGLSYSWFDHEKDNLTLLTQPSLTLQTSPSTALTLASKYRYMDNKTDKEKSYDTWGGLVYLTKRFIQSTIKLHIGYDKDQKKKGKRVDISKENLYAGGRFGYYFFTDTLFSLNYLYEESLYSDIDPALAFARKDRKNLLSLGIRKGIDKNSALIFAYTYLNNDSNINSYSYEKNSYTLNYSYDF